MESELRINTETTANRGKRSNKDRTLTNLGNESKIPSLSQRITNAAANMIQVAAPIPTQQQTHSWAGDESENEISPTYRMQRERERQKYQEKNEQ